MKFSEKWLREWVDLQIDSSTFIQGLSLAGLEVEDYENADKFDGVVVAKILKAEKHPQADKLQVCTVSDGTEEFQVVCGAANARADLITAFAKVGANLPEFKIKKAKLRGVESFGMLCAEDELKLSDDHGGIMELPADAPLGMDLAEYLGIKGDVIIDVDLTPNRADCLSIRGLAREAGAINSAKFRDMPIATTSASIADKMPIEIVGKAQQAAPLYMGRIIQGVNAKAKTPNYIVQKLNASGIRSINALVDITNFVMIELGQPMHAFDLAKIDEKIFVRYAQNGEKLTLLDGKEIALDSEDLLIADAKKPLALGGIMGGEFSGCDENTQDVFLEVAFFDALHLAGKARKHGLHTDSSHRFERGVDFDFAESAMHRASQLILDICGGQLGEINTQKFSENLPKRQEVFLRKSRLEQILAQEFEVERITSILQNLGLQASYDEQKQQWRAIAPSFRFDLSIEVDLIEEVARIYGYDNLPINAPTAQMFISGKADSQISQRRVVQHLSALGFQETINFTFMESEMAQVFAPVDSEEIALANPISQDLAVMRPSLMPSLLKTIIGNQNRRQRQIAVFEQGLKFVKTGDELVQTPSLCLALAGLTNSTTWRAKEQNVNFYDLKAVLEDLFSLGSNSKDYKFVAMEHKALHPGQSAGIFKGEVQIGWIGKLHPSIAKKLGVKLDVFLAEFNLEDFLQGKKIKFQSVSKMPEVKRDFAFVLDRQIPAGEIMVELEKLSDNLLQDISIFDLYQGEGIEEDKKSLALGISWQGDETLTDEKISTLSNKVIEYMQNKYGAKLRS